jgi:predicted acylesterase/phospholipase RssA
MDQAHLADETLRGSERVYRRLGRILSRQGPMQDSVETTSDESTRDPIRTRFVVDILTGASAGGQLNAIYLAKSLANDQDMDELKKLWITEGDIGSLLNDEESYVDLGFKLEDESYPGEPWSLLNSRRMHLRLLEALRQMEETRKDKQGDSSCPLGESPLADELDLFVTATDMQGRVVQLRLADG